MSFFRLAFLFSVLLSFNSLAVYAAATTKEGMIKFVEEAAAFAKEKGKDAALAEFQNKSGKFFRNGGELYMFAYDLNGVNLALPTKPALKGQNLISMKDPDGVLIIQEFIKAAKLGKGEVKYKFTNPATELVEPKLSYIIGMGDWLIGSGIYLGK